MKKDSVSTLAAGENAGLPDPILETPDGEALKLGNIVKRARKGDRKAGSFLKEMGIDVEAAQGPHFSASIYIQEKILDEMGTEDYEYSRGVRRSVAQMRSDLCRVDASPEEHLLVQTVIADWLLLTHLTERYRLGSGARTTKEDDWWQKRINHAHQRHLRSTRMLAQIKKLQRGIDVQLNVAGQQIIQR